VSEEHQVGPYDHIKCHFCGKSAKNGVKFVAGYERRETCANTGLWFPACQQCAEKPYEQPKQFQKEEIPEAF